MFLPTGAPIHLCLRSAQTTEILCVASNRDKKLFAVLTPQSIIVFFAQPQVSLASFTRSEEDLKEKGSNLSLIWKPDSCAVAVRTDKGCLLIFRVFHSAKEQCYNQKEPSDKHLKRTSQELFVKEQIPRISITLAVVVRLSSCATSVVSLREELLVCLQDGWMHRILWNGTVLEEYSVHISKVPFSHDQLQTKPEYLRSESKIYVTEAAYSPLIGGFSLVLSNGKAALLTCPSPKFHPSQLLVVWAPGLDDACCTAVNHKYRLMAFGCSNSEVCAYHLDEVSGALLQAYRVKLAVKDNPEALSNLKSVKCMEWSPYGTVLACGWNEKPVIAFWSVFGSQLWCSVDTMNEILESNDALYDVPCTSIDWGPEGYQIWIGNTKGVTVLNTFRSIGLNNPAMDHEDHICLLGAGSVYLSPARVLEQGASAPHSVWNLTEIPCDYLANSWPLRYCALDAASGTLCVAGSRGLAHCNLQAGKWRLFGNETQERDMVVSGGLAFWNGFVVAACYDVEKGKDDFRFYPLHRQLDNLYCTRWLVDAQILMLSMREDILITFDVEARICLYQMHIEEGTEAPTIGVTRCAEVLVADLIPHPACVVSLQLTSLNHESGAAEFAPGADSILVNVAGRLVMLCPQKKLTTAQLAKDVAPNQLQQPLLVASYVESVWHEPVKGVMDTGKPHLSQALWIQSGAKGTKVWLPLFPSRAEQGNQKGENNPRMNFISKRIMLPFELGIYPLVISSKECLALGIESVAHIPGKGSTPRGAPREDPTWHVHRASEVFLHHLLRQLLKRNLGLYALEIAGTCRNLPYFSHVLELLLHQVLEEEATSSEPIPDPLLPRIVAFIQEFPEFLQTVAHCARKTELALWKTLFNTAGNPKDLFEVCLRDGKLETATSYLIVLQNMETAEESKKHATQLLESSLEVGKWTITRDIVRFLKAIDPHDIESPPRTPLYQKQQQQARGMSLKSPTAEEADAFVFQPMGVSRQRHSSLSAHSPTDPQTHSGGKNRQKTARKTAVGKAQWIDSTGRHGSTSSNKDENPIHSYLNLILTRHARELLSTCRLNDLGSFAAHMEFHLVLWLQKERSRAARIQNFVNALIRLHTDFEWPYPLLSYTVVAHLSRAMSHLSPTKQSNSSATSKDPTPRGNNLTNSSIQPLQIITRRNSMDSGVRTLDIGVSKDNAILATSSNESGGNTKQLLMQQNRQELKLTPRTLEAQLTARKDGHSVAGGTEMTEDSWLSPSSPSWDTETLSNELDWEGLEQLCGEAAARGTQQNEAELRFLQQIMLEAACLEWSMIICLILRDLVGLARAVNVGSLAQAPKDTLPRLRKGVQKLDDWADQNCLGYKPLLNAVQKHLEGLTESLAASGNAHFDLSTPEASSADEPSPNPQFRGSDRPANKPLNRQSESDPSLQRRMTIFEETNSDNQRNFKAKDKSKNTGSKEALFPEKSGRSAANRETAPRMNEWGVAEMDENSIHVDIVSVHTPEDDKGQCVVM